MKLHLWLVAVLALTGSVGGCGGDSDGDDAGTVGDGGRVGDAGPTTPDARVDGGPPLDLATVEERLDHLGIGIESLEEFGGTAFNDFTGEDVGEEAHPLRDPVVTLAGVTELYLLGAPVGVGSVVDLDRPGIVGEPAHVVASPTAGFELLADPVAVALHLDADGREEVVIVDVRPDASRTVSVFVSVMEDEEATPPFALDLGGGSAGGDVGDWATASALAAVARDADGDGIDEVFLVARVGTNWEYRTYDPVARTLGSAVVGGPLVSSGVVGSFVTFSIAAGDVDGVLGEEVAVLVNTRDTLNAGDGYLTVLARTGATETVAHQGVVRMADGRNIVSAGVAFADVDADLVDELVIAGTGTDDSSGSYQQRIVVLDSAQATEVAEHYAPIWEGEAVFPAGRGGGTVRILETMMSVAQTGRPAAVPSIPGAPPPDGVTVLDPAEDVFVNNVLWQWTVPSTPVPPTATPRERMAAMQLPPREVFSTGDDPMVTISSDTVDFAIGQFNDDGLPDAAFLSTVAGTMSRDDAGMLFVRPLIGTRAAQSTTIPMSESGRWGLQLVPVDVDRDGIVVRYVDHVLRYSEPVILAALAAPACYNTASMGQFTNECSTTYGNSSSSASSSDSTYGFRVGLTVGWGYEERVASQTEFKATYTAAATTSFGAGTSTEVSFSSSFTNGAPEDQILATVLAFEQYVYTILSAPNGSDGSSRVGEQMFISIPRAEGRTTRLYSESLIRPALRESQRAAIDAVFDHTPNDPLSYHRFTEVGRYVKSLGVLGPACTPTTTRLGECGYLMSDSHDTPATSPTPPATEISGSGSNIAGSIEVANGTTESTAWGIEGTINLELSTGGAIFGLQMGTFAGGTVTVSHGASVEYGYAIGALDPAVFAGYRARLFAFEHRFDCVDGDCQSFEVINYAIDPIGP